MRRLFDLSVTAPGRLAHLGFAAAIGLAGCRDPESRDTAARPADGALLAAAPQAPSTSGDSTRQAAAGIRPALLIGRTTIWLDSTTIGDVVAALGPAAIEGDRTDRGIERVLSACYTAGGGAEMMTIHLTAQGYLSDANSGVREDTVTFEQSMRLVPVWKAAITRADADSDDLTACMPIAAPASTIQFGGGLRLGIPRDEVERQIGPGWVDDDSVRIHDRRSDTRRGAGTGYLRIKVRYAAGAAAMIETRFVVSESATTIAPMALGPATLDSARKSLRGFLNHSLEDRISSAYERYVACTPDGQNNYSLTLVGYRVLDAVPMTADTILARAAVTSIAVETDSGPGGKEWNVYVGLRRDTMRWRMVRDSASRRWGVCGYSTHGWGFGHWGGDENSTFAPSDMNWARIHALSDSVTRALGDTL